MKGGAMDRNERQNARINMVSSRGNLREMNQIKKRVNVLTVLTVLLFAAVVALALLVAAMYQRNHQRMGGETSEITTAITEIKKTGTENTLDGNAINESIRPEATGESETGNGAETTAASSPGNDADQPVTGADQPVAGALDVGLTG